MTESISTTDQLRDTLDRIIRTDIETQLIRAAVLGAANFGAFRPLFEEIIQYCQRLKALRWEALTVATIANVGSRAEQLADAIVKAGELTLNVANPPQERDNLAVRIADAFTAFKDLTIPHVGFLSWETLDIATAQREMQDVLVTAKSSVDELVSLTNRQLDAQKQEADQILQAIRTASAEAGVGGFHEQFDDAATRHENASKWFLIASIILGAATAAGAVLLVTLWNVNGDVSDASVLQLVLGKAVLLAVGFYATTTAIRMYRSQVHLGIVNRHRETSLKTFQAFAKATEDLETKNKVLLEVTHTIFGQVPTGLVDGRDASNLVEVLDGVTGPLIRRGG